MGMETENNTALDQLEQAEKELAGLEAEFARKEAELRVRLAARRAELEARSECKCDAVKETEPERAELGPAEALKIKEKKIEKMRHLLLGRKEGAADDPAEEALKERDMEISELRQALGKARAATAKSGKAG